MQLQALHSSSTSRRSQQLDAGSQRLRGSSRRHSACRPLAASNRDADDKKAKKDAMVEGFSVDEPDMWEGDGIGIAFQVRS